MWDLTNSFFEIFGGFFIMFSCFRLFVDQKVRGVSWVHVTYFTLWGFWNLAYYPHLGQWKSFIGGLMVVVANCFWLGLMIYYIRKEKQWKEKQNGT